MLLDVNRMGERAESEEARPRWRVSLEIDLPVGSAFAGFCDVDRVGEWVPEVKVRAVLSRFPSGLVERVLLEGVIPGARVLFDVGCRYDANRLRVSWESALYDVHPIGGTVAFLPLGPRHCLMDFEMFEPADSPGLPLPPLQVRMDRSRLVLQSFKRWAETRA